MISQFIMEYITLKLHLTMFEIYCNDKQYSQGIGDQCLESYSMLGSCSDYINVTKAIYDIIYYVYVIIPQDMICSIIT